MEQLGLETNKLPLNGYPLLNATPLNSEHIFTLAAQVDQSYVTGPMTAVLKGRDGQ